jgi:apolipoprotein N-acyltransferase
LFFDPFAAGYRSSCSILFAKLAAMQEALAGDLRHNAGWLLRVSSLVRTSAPTLIEWTGAVATALLLVLSFPNFDLPLLAWIALVPLLIVVARRPSALRAFILGWTAGSVFFYASCYWLTYSMIHYGGLPPWFAYVLLVPGALIMGLFPALFALSSAAAIRRWGYTSVLLAPMFWATTEWLRLGLTGQLWNAIGYTQAQFYDGVLIQPARWGGVYSVSFLILAVNSSIAFAILRKRTVAVILSCTIAAAVVVVIFLAFIESEGNSRSDAPPNLYIVALQPNVPMTPGKAAEETEELMERHLSMSVEGLKSLPIDNVPRLVVWPESPMNFAYASDKRFQAVVAEFTHKHHVSLLFNSLEPAPNEGSYNSALLINEEGRLISQYDKIRLLAFGEYVPLPKWLGGSLISGLVGDFTPGSKYTLMPVGNHRVGVFICVESAYPSISRRLTSEGADLLINISNDGYLGPTAVMRQHLANAIFRSVENGRPLLRVTNSGLSASIKPDGFVEDITAGFQRDVRTWKIGPALKNDTFYTEHGDVFVGLCTVLTIVVFLIAIYPERRTSKEV